MSYFPAEEGSDDTDVEQQRLVDGYDVDDGRTPLDKTIDRIGMGASIVPICIHACLLISVRVLGSYQWTLLSLCGFGETLLRNPCRMYS
jgi:hypothetical protein